MRRQGLYSSTCFYMRLPSAAPCDSPPGSSCFSPSSPFHPSVLFPSSQEPKKQIHIMKTVTCSQRHVRVILGYNVLRFSHTADLLKNLQWISQRFHFRSDLQSSSLSSSTTRRPNSPRSTLVTINISHTCLLVSQ